ncbi:MAG: zinc ribbon domain-containing protein [Dehalococcoidales bacterium]|nr:zinc ribbon domain-containing protein [Dehalococcoidales bacterium]
MPIYEYECRSCGARFELRRGMNDSDAEVICPQCAASEARRTVSRFQTSSSGGCSTGTSG